MNPNANYTSPSIGERLSFRKAGSAIVQPTQQASSSARRSVSVQNLSSSSFIGTSSATNDAKPTPNGMNNGAQQFKKAGSSLFLGSRSDRGFQRVEPTFNDDSKLHNNSTPPGSPGGFIGWIYLS